MTSVRLFSKFCKENRRQKGWLWILSSLVFVVFTFSFFMQDVLMDSDEMYFGLYNVKMMWITLAMAIVIAFQGYGFLLQTRTVDFYYSLPVKRNHLFWGNYLNGVLVYLAPMLISQHVCFFMVCSLGNVGWNELLRYLLWGLFIHMIAFFFFYHLAIAAIHLAGNLSGAVGILIVLLTYVRIAVEYLILPLCEKCFETFYRIRWIEQIRTYGIPWELYSGLNGLYRNVSVNKYTYVAEWTEIVTIVLWNILLLAVCFILQKKRKAESAGTPVAFFRIERVFHTAIDIAVGLLVGTLLLTILSGPYRMIAGVTGCIAGSAFSYLLLEMAFRARIKIRLRQKRWLVIETVMATVIVLGFFAGKDSYDTYLPKSEKIASVGIALSGVDEKEGYSFTEERLRNIQLTKPDDIQKVHTWVEEQLLSHQKSEGQLTDVTIAYHLEHGNVVYRNYPIADIRQIEAFDPIYTTRDYKNGVYGVFSYTDYGKLELTWTNQIEHMTLNLSADETKKLMETYGEELIDLDIATVEREFPIGKLLVADGVFGFDTSVYLYPSFEKTLALLEEYQIPVRKKICEYEIAKIEVTKLREGTKVTQKRDTYTKPKEIKQIAETLVYQGYVIQPVLNPVDTQTKVEVKFQNHSRETVYTVDYYTK